MAAGDIEARILGPLHAAADGRLVLGGERQRACLALLLLARGGTVPREALAEELDRRVRRSLRSRRWIPAEHAHEVPR